MRVRLPGLACLSVACLFVVVAGCETSSTQAAGGQVTASATTSVAATSAAGAACSSTQAPPVATQTLTGLEFASAAQGWAVGQHAILATSDAGAHWRAQLTGDLNLTSVDFISGQDGWAVSTTSLLATTDGGAHWTPLPEPCPAIRSVHFISPTTGFAVAGGSGLGGTGTEIPAVGGVLLATNDGGRTWHRLAAPANAQTACFSDPRHGWLGADGLLYRTADGGKNWTALTSLAGQAGSGVADTMSVECASGGTAWALRVGLDAAMSQEPHVGYHADQAGATPIFAEQYFQDPGAKPAAESPGSYAGPFSALSPSAAVFVDYCPACGVGTAPWVVAGRSGATLTREGNVGSITDPQAASFQSPEVGWVAGRDTSNPATATGQSKSQERIVATTDGGRTWHVEWSGPSTS
jgi:photosystem II stability/assembly factor-like uncharacterized protein